MLQVWQQCADAAPTAQGWQVRRRSGDGRCSGTAATELPSAMGSAALNRWLAQGLVAVVSRKLRDARMLA